MDYEIGGIDPLPEILLNTVYHADNMRILRAMEDNSIDSLVTDPPAGVSFMNKEWDNPNTFPIANLRGSRKTGSGNPTDANGFAQGVQFQSSKKAREAFITFLTEVMSECLRVMKPGAHGFVWALPRTSHWTMTALEDAGFEIRDVVHHIFACVSEDTEILTEKGWTQYQNCETGDLALCYNKDTSTFGWESIEDVLVYDHCDTAYHIHSDNTDQIVTRNHRCLVERDGAYIFQYAEEIAREHQARVPILEDVSDLLASLPLPYKRASSTEHDLFKNMYGSSSKSNKKEKEKEQAPSNGYLHSLQQAIQTKKQPVSQEGKVLHHELCSATQSREPCISIQPQESRINGESWMDKEQQRVLSQKNERSEQSSLAWGSNDKASPRKLQGSSIYSLSREPQSYGDAERLYYGASSYRLDRGREISYTQGSGASYRPQPIEQPDRELATVCEQCGSQEVRTLRYPTPDMASITPIHYDGKVWCIHVPSGAFVARRNGKVFVTGNTGMPKGINVSKAIDKQLGAVRATVKTPMTTGTKSVLMSHPENNQRPWILKAAEAGYHEHAGDVAITEQAQQWEGWNSAIKPAVEYWILVRKPLQEKTIASQILATGTGALNINACRIGTASDMNPKDFDDGHRKSPKYNGQTYNNGKTGEFRGRTGEIPDGRWPAHLILSHAEGCMLTGTKKVAASVGFTDYDGAKTVNSYGKYANVNRPKRGDENGKEEVEAWDCIEGCPVRTLDKQGRVQQGSGTVKVSSGKGFSTSKYSGTVGEGEDTIVEGVRDFGDSGGASRCFTQLPYENIPRFIYIPKASPTDRTMKKLVKNTHPTTKSTHLMAWLNKLITPPGGVILDPFCGGGSTLVAAKRQGFHYIGIEMNEEYAAIARQRLATLDEV